jgi:hypothetical protein
MLNPEMRGALETIADAVVNAIPNLAFNMKQEEAKKLKVKNNDDYILGHTHGFILGSFSTTFLAENKRPTNEEEYQQARDIVYNRTDEIMKAIFKANEG